MAEEKPRVPWESEALWISGRTWCPKCFPLGKTIAALVASHAYIRSDCAVCGGTGRVNVDLSFAELVDRLREELASPVSEATPTDVQTGSEARVIKTPQYQLTEVISDAVLQTYLHSSMQLRGVSLNNTVTMRFDIDGKFFDVRVAEVDGS